MEAQQPPSLKLPALYAAHHTLSTMSNNRISKFSRNDAAWVIPVGRAELEGCFMCVKECQLGHLALSKLVRYVDEGLHSIQPRRRKKVVNYSIFHTPDALKF